MNNESFVFYESVYKQSQILEKRLGTETAMKFLNAVMEFGLYGVVPEEDDIVWLYGFEQTITSIGRAKDRYAAAVENGKKGGRPKSIDDNKIGELIEQGKTNKEIAEILGCSLSSVEKKASTYRKNRKNLNDNENENVNKKDNENNNAKSVLAPPSQDWGRAPTPQESFGGKPPKSSGYPYPQANREEEFKRMWGVT